MLLRVAAWCFVAIFFIAVPASAGVETGMTADTNLSATAAALDISAIDLPAGAAALANTMAVPVNAATQNDAAQQTVEAPARDNNDNLLPPKAADVNAADSNAAEAPITPAHQASVEPVGEASVAPSVAAEQPGRNEPGPKLAALEPITPDLPQARPHSEEAGADLPHIDAAFRFNVLPVSGGDVLTKWDGIRADMRAEKKVFARCQTNKDTCPPAAQHFLDIVDQGRALTGRARIGTINRAINMAIEPTSDMAQWGVPDRWSAPLETFTTHKGDCEDYAIAKYVALIEAGVAPQDVKLMIVRNTAANEDHAVAAVRLDGSWIILDNRWLKMVEDKDMPQAVPLFALGETGVRRFFPNVLIGARRAPAPASIAD